MNEHVLAWNGLFLLVTALLMAAPLYPAWKEWLKPQDGAALALEPLQQSPVPLIVRRFHLTASTPKAVSMAASESITVMPGSRFEKLMAPIIRFGIHDTTEPQEDTFAPGKRCMALHSLPDATPWGDGGWRVHGDCRIPASHHLKGSLVVTGQLSVEHGCLIEGDIKAHGDIHLSPDVVVKGALVGQKNIELEQACRVHGPVVCGEQLSLGAAVILGLPNQTTSVCAQDITAHPTARAHGAVWARHSGQVV